MVSCPEFGSAENILLTRSVLKCRSCGISRCRLCKNMWNVDHRCATSVALARSWEDFKDVATYEMQLRPLGFKRCPACQLACEKQDPLSCDHITCVCGHEFCWMCGEDRRVIKAGLGHKHVQCLHRKSSVVFLPQVLRLLLRLGSRQQLPSQALPVL